MAVLAIDGPGQYEAPMIGVYFSMENWIAAGKPLVDWLSARPEIDPERIGCSGTSFGTFFGTVLTAHEPRIKAFAAMSVCHEPGLPHHLPGGLADLQEALHVHVGHHRRGRVRQIPQDHHLGRPRRENPRALSVRRRRGEELSPIEHSERLVKTLKGPKQMVVYQESRHSVGNVPAANLGPFPPILVADWLADRLAGKPFASEHWFVRSNGQIDKVAY